MDRTALSTEDRIINAARETFLKYGYHGTSLKQIAVLALVHQSAIHYYFRSKNNLYANVLIKAVEKILKSNYLPATQKGNFDPEKWFIQTELYNNETLLRVKLQEFYGAKWETQLHKTKQILNINLVD